ncbi:MAG: hypothetical protein HC922_06705 [Leptolyngbyaceae cyanobacterium SM2_3_12]|nr:hypothetical protein [Leptolyngbyaceae cyanobacterium SM2_3_12]
MTLPPPEEMLREWGRWGDVDAIARVVAAALAPWHLAVEGESANGTLHLICYPQDGDHDTQPGDSLEPKEAILEAIATTLDTLAPQGLHRAVVYGQRREATATPDWVHYLDLPAAQHPALADPPEYLAQIGDLPAIAFLLTRLLNPNLDDRLATGGLRVQLLIRDKLLHIMVDSPVTPHRRLVVPEIKTYLMNLSPVDIEGVRIYGRRSGQSQPAWSYGQDFLSRSRLVPESVPEFTASDAYVNDLLVRPDGPVTHAEVAEAEADIDGVGLWLETMAIQWRRALLRSRLFNSQQPDDLLELGADPPLADNLKIAVVWAAVGILMALQVDWLLGQVMSPPTNPAKAEPITDVATQPGDNPESAPAEDALSEIDWPTAGEAGTTDSAFGNGGFIQSGEAAAAPPPQYRTGHKPQPAHCSH